MATVISNRRVNTVGNRRSLLDSIEKEYGHHWRFDITGEFGLNRVSSQTNELREIIEYGKVGLWADQISIDTLLLMQEGKRFPTLAEAREGIEEWAAFLREHGFTGAVVMDHCEHYFGERVEAHA